MKIKVLMTVLLLIFVCFSTNAQYYVDLNESPDTPIPIKFTLQHFNLNGPIKEYDNTFVKYIFNQEGYLIKEINSYGSETEYFYNSNDQLIKKETLVYDYLLEYNIQRDGGNRVTQASTGTSGTKYTYDSAGNYFEKHNITDNYVSERHFYDSMGRVIKSEFAYPAINETAVKTYSYRIDGDFLIVTSKYVSSNPKTDDSTYRTYYNSGTYYGNTKNGTIRNDSYGNPLHYLNENGLESTAKTYAYFSSTTVTNNTINRPNNPSNNNTTSTVTDSDCTGNCEDGWGKYIYDNGYYQGFWKNGLKVGYGLYYWDESGGSYLGTWTNDKMIGYGVYIAGNDDNIIGEFNGGVLDGLGLTVTGEDWEYGVFTDGVLTNKHNFYSNDVSTGCTTGNCNDGYGRYKWDNGDEFTGFFKNGKLHMGSYSFGSGGRYTGKFDTSGYFTGIGRYFYADGSYYGGEWYKSARNGRGYFHDADKVQQIGEWRDGTLIKSLK